MAELAVTLLQRGVADILHSPLSHHEAAYLREPLPPPLVAGNYESLADKCFVGTSFKDKAVIGRPAAWEWVNESHGPRPKWGYVATKPGSLLTFMVNTTASSGNRSHPVLVQLAYLASYEHMGKAQVRCVVRCVLCFYCRWRCMPSRLPPRLTYQVILCAGVSRAVTATTRSSTATTARTAACSSCTACTPVSTTSASWRCRCGGGIRPASGNFVMTHASLMQIARAAGARGQRVAGEGAQSEAGGRRRQRGGGGGRSGRRQPGGGGARARHQLPARRLWRGRRVRHTQPHLM